MIHFSSILFFIVTILCMAFFAGIEMAYYTANRYRFENKGKNGKYSNYLISNFIKHPTAFLGTLIIGYNLSFVLLGLQLIHVMHPIWQYWAVGLPILHIVIDILLATIIVFLFAEFIPRILFRVYNNQLLSFFSYLLNIIYTFFSPIALILIKLSDWILKYILNVRMVSKKQSINDAELANAFFSQPQDQNNVNSQLLENAHGLANKKIRQSLVPRKEIISVEENVGIDAVWKKFVETKLSKLIVYKKDIDHIIGYVHHVDMLNNPTNIQQILKTIPAVPESMSITGLIDIFSKERKSIAWVVDEFGGTSGIITMEDLLEELFGEIKDEYDTDNYVDLKLNDNEFILRGRLELDDIKLKYGLNFLSNEAETLSGYIIDDQGSIPNLNQRIIIGNYEFEILNVSATRIETVKLRVLK